MLSNNEKQGLAKLLGDTIYEAPRDLFIPPNALEVVLDSFEGPLDFLLYIIKKQRLDIVDLPVFKITKQYMDYVNLMMELDVEIAADYLVMASILTDIKSRMLLPVIANSDDVDDDPRATLVERLLEYEKFKRAANEIAMKPMLGRDFYSCSGGLNDGVKVNTERPSIEAKELALALKSVLERAKRNEEHTVKREELSTRDRMRQIMNVVSLDSGRIRFDELCKSSEGVAGVVVTFLALLELVKEQFLSFTQADAFGVIYIYKTNIEGLDLERLL